MTVSFPAYYLIIAIVSLLIISVPLYNRFIKKRGRSKDYLYLLLLFWFPINWYTPAVYIITDCKIYRAEVLLFPAKVEGYDLKNGWYNYIINKSRRRLILFDELFGNVDEEDVAQDVLIEPGTMYRAPFVHLDYIFQNPPKNVRTKKKGEIKHRLACTKQKSVATEG